MTEVKPFEFYRKIKYSVIVKGDGHKEVHNALKDIADNYNAENEKQSRRMALKNKRTYDYLNAFKNQVENHSGKRA